MRRHKKSSLNYWKRVSGGVALLNVLLFGLGAATPAATNGLQTGQNVGANASQAMQTRPEISRIAAQTAKKIAQVDLHHILTTPLSGCLGAPQLCEELDAALRADLVNSIPGAQFIEREEAMKHLAAHGFLSVDAYEGALDSVGSDAGADVVVGEQFEGQRGGCHLHTTVVDAKRLYALADFTTRISCAAAPTKTFVSLLQDPASGASMIVSIPQSPDAPTDKFPVHGPSCLSCPDPRYSAYAREKRIGGLVRIMITITEQGTVQNAKALGAVDEGLKRASLEAVSGWVFKPAEGPDGKPFRARVLVEVTFRIYLTIRAGR